MSYNVYLAGIRTVGTTAAAGGLPVVVGLPSDERYRLTVPHLTVRCGSVAETLTVMGVVEFSVLQEASVGNDVVLREPLETLIENHYVAYGLPDGQIVVDTVVSATLDGDVMTVNLATEPPQELPAGTKLYRFGEATDDAHFRTVLATSTDTDFEAGAPGRFIAADYGFPLIVHITNTNDEAMLVDAICAYIDV